jgi:hypothetical protein
MLEEAAPASSSLSAGTQPRLSITAAASSKLAQSLLLQFAVAPLLNMQCAQ